MRTHVSSAFPAPPAALARLAAAALLGAAACGGGGGDGPTGNGNGNGTLTVAAANPSGNAQTAATGATLPAPLRVLVRRDGNPASGVSVTWTVTSGGGQIEPDIATTGNDGIATATWQLGLSAGQQGARAAVAAATGSPVAFTATATGGGGGGGGNVVAVENNQFTPQTITVSSGATVRWQWGAQSLQHNIIPIGGAAIPSVPETRDGPSTYEATFAAAGTYAYYCSNHGTPTSGMRGTVVVQ